MEEKKMEKDGEIKKKAESEVQVSLLYNGLANRKID
jgi:hypothetical protein